MVYQLLHPEVVTHYETIFGSWLQHLMGFRSIQQQKQPTSYGEGIDHPPNN